jgi:hypothetical protein
MAMDMIARGMALSALRKGDDAYTKAETDELLDGKADLVNGKVPASQLPSYVDDTIEGYYYDSKFYEDAQHITEITEETGKIYIDISSNKSYRWTGSVYTRIDECPAFGEIQGTIYEGNKGKANADAISAIKDGTNIDSFADVETALANIPQVTVDQTYSASSTNAQSGTAVASAISGKITATDYATQNTGGTIKAWTTTDGSDTILHLATQ